MVSTSKINNKKADAKASAYSHRIPLWESGILTFSLLLKVRRTFSLLYYPGILSRGIGIVKGYFMVFLNFLLHKFVDGLTQIVNGILVPCGHRVHHTVAHMIF